MNYKLKCTTCGATCWCAGSFDRETNATELKDQPLEWDNETIECDHPDHEIIDEEDPED